MAELEYSVNWQGTVPFYSHLGDIWKKSYEARIKAMVSVSQDAESVPIALEVWWESLLQIYDTIIYYLSDDEKKEVEKIISDLEEITSKKSFYHYLLVENHTDGADKIKIQCSTLNRKMWFFLGKYKFLPKKQAQKIYGTIEEQIEAENE
jgi:hypothetical protein